jgi:glycogen synthase
LKIVLASEVFPPRAGGAGWSTRALAVALKDAGHDVTVVTTAEGPDHEAGVPVARLAPGTGVTRRAAMKETFREALADLAWDADVVHAQHSLSALGALSLDPRPRTVVTIRDHWPVCFWSTRISQERICPACTTLGMWRCLDGRLPRVTAPAAIPYMKWDLRDKKEALTRADGVIAVSEAIARELQEADVPRLSVIPNIVDAREVSETAARVPTIPLPERFVLFVGKLEANKGARDLIPAMNRSGASLPLVILGSGTCLSEIQSDAAAAKINLVTPGWADRADVLRAMGRADALLFPSTWPEPLSRVLLEALALGTPIAAMDTGGTSEMIEHERSGLLARSVDELGAALGRIVHDSTMREGLKAGATLRSLLFSPQALVPRYESVYRGELA